ncbi:hypothetical protein M513_06580, partial [Trichuris suis]
MDAQAVLPFRDDLQSANNGVLRCQCERRFTDEAPKMLEEFGINLIPHPAYSAGLGPNYYHFFQALKLYVHQKVHRTFERLKRIPPSCAHFNQS